MYKKGRIEMEGAPHDFAESEYKEVIDEKKARLGSIRSNHGR